MNCYRGVLNQMAIKAKREIFRINFCKCIDSGPSMIIVLDLSKTKDGNKYELSASKRKKTIQRFNYKFFQLYYYLLFYYLLL